MKEKFFGFYSLKEVAEGFNKSRASVSYWINTGKLETTNFGNAKLVTPNSVLEFAEKYPHESKKIRKDFLERVKADVSASA